jgi:hypothetical protein
MMIAVVDSKSVMTTTAASSSVTFSGGSQWAARTEGARRGMTKSTVIWSRFSRALRDRRVEPKPGPRRALLLFK